MRQTYSFLNDSLAVQEIRKHKWLESEKTGQEIGFATAAVDWVQQYGEAFKRYRGGTRWLVDPPARRTAALSPLSQAAAGPAHCRATPRSSVTPTTSTWSACPARSPRPLSTTARPKITIRFQSKGISPLGKKFSFRSRVSRVQPRPSQDNESGYNIFVPFSDEVRDFVRANHEILAN